MIILKRFAESKNGTFGVILKNENPVCFTLELNWRFNQKNVSCIPTGLYECEQIKHSKFKKCIIIKNVPNRDGILFHTGNTIKDSEGCILTGLELGTLNKEFALLKSREALNKLLLNTDEQFLLKIV